MYIIIKMDFSYKELVAIKGQTYEQAEDTLQKLQKELRMQEMAIEILQEEEKTKNEQIDILLAKRQELHLEKRDKKNI